MFQLISWCSPNVRDGVGDMLERCPLISPNQAPAIKNRCLLEMESECRVYTDKDDEER